MVSGSGAAGHEAARAAEGIIAREAKEVLRDAEKVGARDAAKAADDAAEAAGHNLERTLPAGTGAYTGRPTRIGPRLRPDIKRSYELENATPHTLTGHGYRVHQNPNDAEIAAAAAAHGDRVRAGADPDYLIEGKVFDNYAPGETKSVRGIATEVEKKVVAEQTQRVVVNLTDWKGSLSDLTQQFTTWPVAGLKELMVVQADGSFLHLLAG